MVVAACCRALRIGSLPPCGCRPRIRISVVLRLETPVLTPPPALSSPCQHQGDVVGLFIGPDPIVDGGGHDLANSLQWQVAVLPHEIDEPLLAEFAEIIFGFGDTVAVSKEKLSLA